MKEFMDALKAKRSLTITLEDGTKREYSSSQLHEAEQTVAQRAILTNLVERNGIFRATGAIIKYDPVLMQRNGWKTTTRTFEWQSYLLCDAEVEYDEKKGSFADTPDKHFLPLCLYEVEYRGVRALLRCEEPDRESPYPSPWEEMACLAEKPAYDIPLIILALQAGLPGLKISGPRRCPFKRRTVIQVWDVEAGKPLPEEAFLQLLRPFGLRKMRLPISTWKGVTDMNVGLLNQLDPGIVVSVTELRALLKEKFPKQVHVHPLFF